MVESVSIKKKLRPGKLSLEKAYAAGRDNSKVTITDIALTKRLFRKSSWNIGMQSFYIILQIKGIREQFRRKAHDFSNLFEGCQYHKNKWSGDQNRQKNRNNSDDEGV